MCSRALILGAIIIGSTSALWGMQQASCTVSTPVQEFKNKVQEYLIKKEEHFKKESFYARPDESLSGNVVILTKSFIDKEIESGVCCINGDKIALCADNKVFVGNTHNLHEPFKIINMASRVETLDHTLPAISAILPVAKFLGMPTECVLLGENNGRILIAESLNHQIKTFAKVAGKVLSFACHPLGNQLAVIFSSKNSQGLSLPCFALAAAYTKKEQSSNAKLVRTRSWSSGPQCVWSDCIVDAGNAGVKAVRFTADSDRCTVEYLNGSSSAWVLKDVETTAQLVKLEEK